MVAQLKDKGNVSRGWIGVQVQPVTQDIADGMGLKQAQGALVADPQKDGPAAKAGIEAGDVITAVNGEPVKDARELARVIGGLAPGSTVKLDVLQKGKSKVVSMTLGKLPNDKQAKADIEGDGKGQRRAPTFRVWASRLHLPIRQIARKASSSRRSNRKARRPNAASRRAT